jgi:hypothetical protein
VIAGSLAAGPLALAFIWEHVTVLRFSGLEVTLVQASVPLASSLATALSSKQDFSGRDDILQQVGKAIADPVYGAP